MKLFEDTLEMNKPYYIDSIGSTVGILEKRDEDFIYFHPLVNETYIVESDGYIKLAKINYVYHRTAEGPKNDKNKPNIRIGVKYYVKDQPELGYVIPKTINEEQDNIQFENHTIVDYVEDGDGLVIFYLTAFNEFFEIED